MGSIGRDNNVVEKDTRSVGVIYRDDNVGVKRRINKMFFDKQITQEQRTQVVEKIDKSIQTILEKFVDGFQDSTIKAIKSTMDRKFILTSDSDITGNAEFYKTPNGFILNMDSTRSRFRAFMDNDGNVRRMPSNEMKLAERIDLSNQHYDYLSRKFNELYWRE